jgi:hypothetical protein
MDDELPVIIFILINSKVSNWFSIIKLLEFYLKNKENSDQEQRYIYNIEAGLNYIIKEFKG